MLVRRSRQSPGTARVLNVWGHPRTTWLGARHEPCCLSAIAIDRSGQPTPAHLWALAGGALLCACLQAEIGDPDSDPYGHHQDDPVELGGDQEADRAGGGDEREPRRRDAQEDGPPPDADRDENDAVGCAAGETRPCWPGAAEVRGVGACRDGTETCGDDSAFGACEGATLPGAEVCGNAIDEDCDGAGAECPFVTLVVQGNCTWVTCPGTHPYPVGCDVQFSGTDDDGCVAWATPSSTVFFMDGDDCDDGGALAGTLTCGQAPGSIDEGTCVLRVENPEWEDEADDC